MTMKSESSRKVAHHNKIIAALIIFISLFYVSACVYNRPPLKLSIRGESIISDVYQRWLDEKVLFPPISDGENLYIRTKHFLYKINVSTGDMNRHPLWGRSSRFDKMLVKDNYVIVSTGAWMSVYSAETLDLLWQHIPVISNGIKLIQAEDATIKAIELSQNRLYVARYNLALYAYDVHNGNVLWNIPAPSRQSLELSARTTEVYLLTGNEIIAYGAENGREVWKAQFNGFIHSPRIENELLYFFEISTDRRLVCFNLSTQNMLWEQPVNYFSDSLRPFITIHMDNIITVGDWITVLAKDGKVSWVSEQNRFVGKVYPLENTLIVGGNSDPNNEEIVDDLYFYNWSGEEIARLTTSPRFFEKDSFFFTVLPVSKRLILTKDNLVSVFSIE